MTCPTCGSENPADARFCGECGTALPAAAAPTEAMSPIGEPTAVIPPVPPPGAPGLAVPGGGPPAGRSGGSRAGAALLVLLALLVIGGVVALLLRDDDEDDPVAVASTTTTTVEPTTTAAQDTTTTVEEETTTTTAPDDATTTSVDLGSGDVQVTLEWDSAADLDLAVTDPTGEQVSFTTPESSTGGRLDADANESCEREGDPVENIFWPTDGAPAGTYTVDVTGYTTDGCENGPEDGDYTLTIRVAGEDDQVITDHVDQGETKTVTFEVA